jgi:hypothetical protein
LHLTNWTPSPNGPRHTALTGSTRFARAAAGVRLALLRIISSEGDVPTPRLVARMNEFVYRSTPASKYATFFYAQLDVQRRQPRYVNAGHFTRSQDGPLHEQFILPYPRPHGPDGRAALQAAPAVDLGHHRGPERQHQFVASSSKFLRKDAHRFDTGHAIELA